MRNLLRHVLLVVAVLIAGCGRAPQSSALPLKEMVYEVRGVLQRADAVRGAAVIVHEEIAGYMEAMTMEFTAATPGELAGLEPGDVLTFRLRVGERDSRIEQIRKVGHTDPPKPVVAADAPVAGAEVPDCALVDDAGRAFRLSEKRGVVLAVTFIFTRCPLPDFCPRMNSHFAAVHRELSAASLEGKWELLSVTLDPAYDTPERLAAYAAPMRGDARRWIFATGERGEIAKLGGFFGLLVKGEGSGITHNLRTAVVDADGRVQRVFTGNDWKPADLFSEMKTALSSKR